MGVTEAAAPVPIQARLAQSLRHIDEALDLPEGPETDLAAVARHLDAGGALQPEAYGHYYALIRALQGERPDSAMAHIRHLAASPRDPDAGITIRLLGTGDFTRPELRAAKANFTSESLRPEQLRPIPAAAALRVRRALRGAMDIIRAHAPASWSDFSRITTEIIAASGSMRDGMTFDGCSSLERYGSILVNMRRNRTPLVLAETLVHESAHSLLFALSCDEHRVLNPPSERYKSPLRIDPRPLDGIFHAAFVLARMHGFLAEIAESGSAPAPMRAEARKLAVRRRENFLDGYGVLAGHARFTETGRALIEDARERVERASAA